MVVVVVVVAAVVVMAGIDDSLCKFVKICGHDVSATIIVYIIKLACARDLLGCTRQQQLDYNN